MTREEGKGDSNSHPTPGPPGFQQEGFLPEAIIECTLAGLAGTPLSPVQLT